MKTAHFSRFGHRAAWILGAVLLFAHSAVQACPGCKQATDGKTAVPLNGDSVGFGLSIFFMLFMIASVLGGLGFMMYRSCRALAARDATILAGMEAEEAPALTRRADNLVPVPGGWAVGLAHGHS